MQKTATVWRHCVAHFIELKTGPWFKGGISPLTENNQSGVFMKMFLSLAAALLVTATSAFAADIAKEHSNVRISDARYFEVATRTEIREIPGCRPYGESSNDCTEVIVLERKPVVEVTVSYTEGVFRDPEMREGYVVFSFDVNEFDASDIAALKKASRLWSLTGGKVRKAFAKNNFTLESKLVSRTIQIVDVRNSTLCQQTESGEPRIGCEEVLVYKPAQIIVREVNVLKK